MKKVTSKIKWMVAAIVIVVILAVVGLIVWLTQRSRLATAPVDCMPPLSEQEAEACRRAEELGNPNITY